MMGNKDDKFVEERRALLERFMKEVAKHDYLTQSKEFKVFARDRGDIEKILGMMNK
jgi:sorting nexin-1/2